MVLGALTAPRDRTLFILGIRSGFRISELLSLRVSDVCQYGRILNRIVVRRQHMKKQVESRSVALHPAAKEAIRELLNSDWKLVGDMPLFRSRKGGAIGRTTAWRILDAAFVHLEMTGQLGTHSMRKTFANKVYHALDKDLLRTQKALGHRNLDNTARYLDFADEEVDDAITSVA